MSTIPLNELSEWLLTSAGDEIRDLRERAESLVENAIEALNGILEVAKEIGDSDNLQHASVGKSEKEIAIKFGERVASLGTRIRRPDPMTYDNLRTFLEDLGEFYRDLIRTGSVWIRKLDRSYKDPVRRMQLQLNAIRNSAKILDEHLQQRYREVRKLESLSKDLESAKSIATEIETIKQETKLITDRADQLKTELSNLEALNGQLEVSEEQREAKDLESQVEKMRTDMKRALDPLEKPFDKFLRLPEKEKIGAGSDTLQIISEYVTDPIGALSREQTGLPRLRSVLNVIRNALEDHKLELKESRVRAALRSISEIQEGEKLNALKEEYMEAFALRDRMLQSDTIRELSTKRKQIAERTELIKTELARIERSVSDFIIRREELAARLTDQKEKMERDIKTLTGQTVHLAYEL